MSELIDDVANELGVVVRREGGLNLIPLRDCGRIVEACGSRRLLILGIEAFSLSQGEVIPDMDLTADFSELVKQEWNAGCLQAAHAAQI